MNKHVSRSFAFIIIIVVAVLAWINIIHLNSDIDIAVLENNPRFHVFPKKNPPKEKECAIHAYQGEAAIKVYYVPNSEKENDWSVKIAEDDWNKLPVKIENENFSGQFQQLKLVDIDKSLQNKLAKSTAQDPISITITGYATRCDDIALASINYEEGIFHPYLPSSVSGNNASSQ